MTNATEKKKRKPLTKDLQARNAKPEEKPYKLSAGRGLFLEVRPNGTKLWRFAYRFQGRHPQIALGEYPDVSLDAAITLREDARKLLAQDPPVDPAAAKREQKAEAVRAPDRAFRVLADAWKQDKLIEEIKPSAATLKRETRNVNLLNAAWGTRDADAIKPRDVIDVLRPFKAKGHHEAAARLRLTASRIFQYGVAGDLCERDPAADVVGWLIKPEATSRAALVEPDDVGTLMRDIKNYEGRDSNLAGYGLQFLSLTVVRPGEQRKAEWAEFDLDNAVWCIPYEKTKQRGNTKRKKGNTKRKERARNHLVPLSRQAMAILQILKPITGHGRYVFSTGDKPMSDNTLNKALKILGYDTTNDHTSHGFRTTFDTMINEERTPGGDPVWHPDVVEACLAHVDDDSVRGIYNRAKYWSARVKLMQHWADRIDSLSGGNVTPIKKKAA